MKPTMKWRTPPHNECARVIESQGVRYLAKPEGPGAARYRLFIDGRRTEVFGSGLHYVMVRAENIMRRGDGS